MKVKKLESLLLEMKMMEAEGNELNYTEGISQEKDDLLEKVSDIYGVPVDQIKSEYEEINIL